jgi:hypothetical protein
LHLVAVLLYWLLGRENLVATMFSGRKKLSIDPRLRFVGNGIALLLFVISVALVVGLVIWGNQAAG